MRCRIQALLATFIALVAIATTATPTPADFSYGTMQASCAPWDGPAIVLTLTNETSRVQTNHRAIPLPRSVAWPSTSIRTDSKVRPGIRRRLRLPLQKRKRLRTRPVGLGHIRPI